MTDKPNDTHIPEISVESIMVKIREEANRRRRDLQDTASPEGMGQAGDSPGIDTSRLHAIISAAEQNADVGAEVTPMEEFSGLSRKLALFFGRKIVYLANFITFKQRNFNRGIIDALKTITYGLESISGGLTNLFRREMQQHVEALNMQIGAVRDEHTATRTALESLRSCLQDEVVAGIADLANVQAGQARELADLRSVQAGQASELVDLRSGQAATREDLTKLIIDFNRRLTERDALIKNLEHRLAAMQTSVAQQERRTATLLEEARKPIKDISQHNQSQPMSDEGEHLLDSLYVAFEDRFRGSSEEIKERVRVYLPVIRETGAGCVEGPVLDVGCGRGEWLELLREEELHGRGIDLNRVMVEQCSAQGLNVIEIDVLTYLRSLPDATLGAVTGFHLIEHLPFETLIAMLDEALRVLRPGGVVIFETPNPENVLVGSCNFYMDPTHRNPLPSKLTKFLLESRGFHNAEIIELNPSVADRINEPSEVARRLNEYFYGSQDYSVIGYRP